MKPALILNRFWRQFAIALLFLPLSLLAQETGEAASSGAHGGLYELRIYYPHANKLDELLTRFRTHTTGLFEKHGFTNVGYWVTRSGESPSYATRIAPLNQGEEFLLYIISFPDMESRNKSWEAFESDPEWKRVYEESRRNGPLVREIDQLFLDPTDFSLLK